MLTGTFRKLEDDSWGVALEAGLVGISSAAVQVKTKSGALKMQRIVKKVKEELGREVWTCEQVDSPMAHPAATKDPDELETAKKIMSLVVQYGDLSLSMKAVELFRSKGISIPTE